MAFGRTWLYSKDAPKGKIFDDEDEFKKALKDGWVEAPWLVGQEHVESEEEKPIKNAFSYSNFTEKLKVESEPVVSNDEPTIKPKPTLGPKRG